MSVPLINTQRGLASPSSTKVMILVDDRVSLTTVSATLEPFQCANTLLEQNKFTLQLHTQISEFDPDTAVPRRSNRK